MTNTSPALTKAQIIALAKAKKAQVHELGLRARMTRDPYELLRLDAQIDLLAQEAEELIALYQRTS